MQARNQGSNRAIVPHKFLKTFSKINLKKKRFPKLFSCWVQQQVTITLPRPPKVSAGCGPAPMFWLDCAKLQRNAQYPLMLML